MKKRFINMLIAFVWVGAFGYLIYKELYAVALLSSILLGMILALGQPNGQ